MSHFVRFLSLALLLTLGGFSPRAGETIPPNEEKLAQVKEGTITEAYASWWGYNTEDTTEILQTAMESGVQVLHIDKMAEPWIVRPLSVPSNIELILEEDVTVLAKEGEFRGLGDSLISIAGENVTIRGGRNSVFLMRKKDYQNPPYLPSEWRHGIHLFGAKNFKIENVIIRSSGGDGIYIGPGNNGGPCENVTIRNIYSDDNNRQGITVITGRNILIEDCLCANTKGLPPESGIDIEPNKSNQCVVNCVVRNCVFYGNTGDGIELYLPNLNTESEPVSITIENCISQWNGRFGLSHQIDNGDGRSVRGDVTLRDIDLRNNHFEVKIGSKGTDAHTMKMENFTIDTTINKDPTRSPITLSVWLSDQYSTGNMEWKNITIIDPMERNPINYIDRTPFHYGLFNIEGSLTLKKSVDDPGTTEIINDAWLAEKYPGSRCSAVGLVEPDPKKVIPSHYEIAPAKQPSELISRNTGEWYLYGTKGVPMKFSMVQRRYNPNYYMQDEVTPRFKSPSGKEIPLDPFTAEITPYEIIPEETGIYSLRARSDEHNVVLLDCNVPYGAYCYSAGLFASANATYYFAVPEGKEQFALCFYEYGDYGEDGAEPGKITVIDPNGEERWHSDDIISGAVFFDSKETAIPGVWSFKVEKYTDQIQQFFVTFYGMAGFVGPEPDKLLIHP